MGFAIFVSVEVTGITVSKIIVKWFKGKEMALAMGLEMATARLGTALAMTTSIPIARALNGVSKLFLLFYNALYMISFIVYTFMDKNLINQLVMQALLKWVKMELKNLSGLKISCLLYVTEDGGR